MIVLDTHALLWWALDPDRLSPAAIARVREMERTGGFASAISIWELGIKIQRGKLDLGIPIEEFVRASTRARSFSCFRSTPQRGQGASISRGIIATP